MKSAEETGFINSNPIGDGLMGFRQQFESARARLGFVQSTAIHSVLSGESGPDLILDLIVALQTLPAARILRSRIDHNARLRADLFSLGSQVGSSDFDIKVAIPLLELVIKNAPDIEIWDAVFRLLAQARLSARTSPYAIENTAVFDTPFRSGSASQSGVEQTHDEVDQRILEELTGRVYYNVGDFYERFFLGKAWINKARDIFKVSMSPARYSDGSWINWPEPSLQDPFFEWFANFQDTVLKGLRGKYYTSASKELRGSEAGRKLDIFLAPTDTSFHEGKYDWSNVLVIGEHKRNPDEDRSVKTLVQLAGYAREVFGSQPERRYIHGFTICGSVMRLWIFDRSGPYNSEGFNIHKEPERFVTVLAGYQLMTDAELGLNTFIKRDGTKKYVVANETKISIEDKPIASTKAIVCRGTTCYRGRGIDSAPKHVVKFAWPSDKRQEEGRLLKLAKQRGVTGIAEWIHDERVVVDGIVDTIANLRHGMKFGEPRTLSTKSLWVESPTGSSRANSKTRTGIQLRSKSSIGRLSGLGIPTSSSSNSSAGQKRNRDAGSASQGGAMKRSKSSGSQAAFEQPASDVNEHGRAPSSLQSIEEPEDDSLTGRHSETYGNRIHTCLVTSPAGRPLQSFRSVRELLEAIRDAISAHRSLLEDGKILHRDISENNIIITASSVEGEPKGRLIDLDLAKELNSAPSGASHRTGTMQFMAIEVLQGKGHTYRHDLESFFYVFIWMCIRYGHENVSDVSGVSELDGSKSSGRKMWHTRTSILRGWYTGTYAEMANIKRGHMVGFEDITAEFPPRFHGLKGLAEELRDVLFPIRGSLFIGTYKDRSIMYDGMANAFDRAIANLEP